MLLNRLGGSEMASLLEEKHLRDCIPSNLTFSFDIYLEFKYAMTCKPEYEIMGAKRAYCTQVITLSSKHFDNVTAKQLQRWQNLNNLNFLGYKVPDYVEFSS